MKNYLLALAMGAMVCLGPIPSALAEPDGRPQGGQDPNEVFTLRQAISRTFIHNPELAVFSFEKRVQEARTLQSGLAPNPQLEVTVEDATGSGDFGGFNRSETTIQLSQLIELGGKRAARVQAGRLSEKLADWDYETKRMDVLSRVSKAFIDVLRGQHQVALSRDLVKLGTRFHDAVSERVRAGKVARVEKIKAEVALSSLKIDLNQAAQRLKSSRQRLSAFWGETSPRFEAVLGDIFSISSVPPFEELKNRLSNNPNLARWSAELERRQTVLDAELSKRIPDVTVMGGYRRLEETKDNTVTFGISIPLQLFNRNQGKIAEARNQLGKAREQRRVVELRMSETLSQTYNNLTFSHFQVTAIKTQILPGAKKAFEAMNEGYRFGKFGLLEVLDSQKTFFQAQRQYLDALASYHKAVTDMERLTGERLTSEKSRVESPEGPQSQ